MKLGTFLSPFSVLFRPFFRPFFNQECLLRQIRGNEQDCKVYKNIVSFRRKILEKKPSFWIFGRKKSTNHHDLKINTSGVSTAHEISICADYLKQHYLSGDVSVHIDAVTAMGRLSTLVLFSDICRVFEPSAIKYEPEKFPAIFVRRLSGFMCDTCCVITENYSLSFFRKNNITPFIVTGLKCGCILPQLILSLKTLFNDPNTKNELSR